MIGSCRIFWTANLSAGCEFEKLGVNGSYAFSTLVPLLSGMATTYTLELQIPHYDNIVCGSVLSYAPDTTISVSPSTAFSSGGQFLVTFQNFPLSSTSSSLIPVSTESSVFLSIVSFESLIQSDVLSGRMSLSFSLLNPGRQSLKIYHASIAICSATAAIDILDPMKPRIAKLSPLKSPFTNPSFFELQVIGTLPSTRIFANGILFGDTGQILVTPWHVVSVSLSDSIYAIIVRSPELPESGKCTIQLLLSDGVIVNSSNLTFINPKSLAIESVGTTLLLIYFFLFQFSLFCRSCLPKFHQEGDL